MRGCWKANFRFWDFQFGSNKSVIKQRVTTATGHTEPLRVNCYNSTFARRQTWSRSARMNLADRDGQIAQSHCTLHIAHCTITLHISVYCLHFAVCTTALAGRPLKSDAEQKKAREQRNSAELSWKQFQKYLFHRRIKIPEFSPPLEGKAMHFEMEFIEEETENLGPRVKKRRRKIWFPEWRQQNPRMHRSSSLTLQEQPGQV